MRRVGDGPRRARVGHDLARPQQRAGAVEAEHAAARAPAAAPRLGRNDEAAVREPDKRAEALVRGQDDVDAPHHGAVGIETDKRGGLGEPQQVVGSDARASRTLVEVTGPDRSPRPVEGVQPSRLAQPIGGPLDLRDDKDEDPLRGRYDARSVARNVDAHRIATKHGRSYHAGPATLPVLFGQRCCRRQRVRGQRCDCIRSANHVVTSRPDLDYVGGA